MERMEKNENEPFLKISPPQANFDDEPRPPVSTQRKLTQAQVVDFEENKNAKQDGDVAWTRMANNFSGSGDNNDWCNRTDDSYQIQNQVETSNKIKPLFQCGFGSGNGWEDLNVTSPKIPAHKYYDRETIIRRSQLHSNANLSSKSSSMSMVEFQCPHCRKSYFSFQSLRIHVETHSSHSRKKKNFINYRGGGSIVFPANNGCNFESSNVKRRTFTNGNQFHQLGNFEGFPPHSGSTERGGNAPSVPAGEKLPTFKGRTVKIPTEEPPKPPIGLHKPRAQVSAPSRTHLKGNASKEKSTRENSIKRMEGIWEKGPCKKLQSAVQSQSNHLLQISDPTKTPPTIQTSNFSCHYCGKIFFSRRFLEVHLRFHTGEKCPQVHIFNYRSNQPNKIRAHRAMTNLVTCTICGYAVSSIPGLNSPYKKAHKDDSEHWTEFPTPNLSQEINLLTIMEPDFEEEPQEATFFKSTSPKQNVKISEEVNRNDENSGEFPEQQLEKKSEWEIFRNVELLANLGKKDMESHELEIMTPEASLEQNSATQRPSPYKCEFCNFNCKFQIGLNKHVAKSHANISLWVEENLEQVPKSQRVLKEVLGIEQISDEKYEHKIFANEEYNKPEVNPWNVIEATQRQGRSVSQGEPAFACPDAQGSIKGIPMTQEKLHQNSTIYACQHCDFASHCQMATEIHTKILHEIKFNSQSEPPQPPLQNGRNLEPGPLLSIPACTSSSISSLAPPASILTLQLVAITHSVSAPSTPKSLPLIPQPHTSNNNSNNNSTFPSQFNSKNSAAVTSPEVCTPKFANPASEFPHQLITPQLLGTGTRSNGNIPATILQPEPQSKSSSHFNLNPTNGLVGKAATINSKSWTTQKPFVCPYCSRGFKQRNQLIRHARIHTREKPFKCDKCNYATSHQQSLVIHRRRHTGERPYSCDICGHTSASLPALYIHRKRHAKPFKCRFCPRVSGDEGVIERHEKRHAITAPLKRLLITEPRAGVTKPLLVSPAKYFLT